MATATITSKSAHATIAGAHLVGYTEHPRMSEETTAFDAEVHLNGIRVGTLSNDGRGGESLFRADSREANDAYRKATESYAGITHPEYGFTSGLSDTLADLAALAKQLHTRGVSFIPDTTPEDALRESGLAVYKMPASVAKDLDGALALLMSETDATTLLYPVKEKKGHWLHIATR